MSNAVAKRETNNVQKFNPAQNNNLPSLDEYVAITNADFYSPGGGKNIANARVINLWAKDNGIKTEIVKVVNNEKRIRVIVRAWIGDKDKPVHEATDIVTYDLEQEYSRVFIEFTNKKIKYKEMSIRDIDYKLDGTRIKAFFSDEFKKNAKSISIITQWITYWSQWLSFAERTAKTKAESRAQQKLLGLEFREKKEIEEEKREIEAVAESNQNNHPQKQTEEKQENPISFLRKKMMNIIQQKNFNLGTVGDVFKSKYNCSTKEATIEQLTEFVLF